MMLFSEVWKRIAKETDIKSNTQLAKIIGKTQQAVSKKKLEGKEFPIDWAYWVAHEYNLSTKWLLTGKGPKRIGEGMDSYVLKINEWLGNLKRDDPRSEQWFQYKFEKKFPEFKDWFDKDKQGTTEIQETVEVMEPGEMMQGRQPQTVREAVD